MRKYRFLLALIAIFVFSFATISLAATRTDRAISSCIFNRDLTVGSVNDPATNDVVNLQNFLVSKGFLASNSGGIFDSALRSAVAAYQASKNIDPAAGYFGPITRSALSADCLKINQITTVSTQLTSTPMYRMVTSTSGTGQGIVLGGGRSYSDGSTVTLEAVPAMGSKFSGWNNGRASGKSLKYSFVITEDQVANAIFDLLTTTNNNTTSGNTTTDTSSNSTTTPLYTFTTYLNNAPGGTAPSSGSISGTQNATKPLTSNTSVTGTYPRGTIITITAEPGPESLFLTWFGHGPCAKFGANPTCTFELIGDMGTEAVFKSWTDASSIDYGYVYIFERGTSGNGGTVLGDSSGNYSPGSTISIQAVPSTGYEFAGWSGKCYGQGANCSFVISGDVSAFAQFRPVATNNTIVPNTATTYTFTVTKAGAGQGTVTGAGTYPAGTRVTVTAVPDAESFFAGWNDGECSGRALTCTLILNGNKSVNANFDKKPTSMSSSPSAVYSATTYTFTVTKAGAGQGTVTGAGTYPAGTRVTVTAVPDAGSFFAGWNDGECSGRALTCTLILNGNKSVNANFDKIKPTSMFSSPSAIYSAIKSALNLQKGSVQDGVAALQRYLNSKGYVVNTTPGEAGSPGNESTCFGDKTKGAVMKFQQDNGIPATGVVGSQTKEAMRTK